MTLTQITEKGIKNGEIIDADINSSAEIAVNKLANGTARQLLQTAANGTDVEFTSNVALPGTLHVASNGNIAGTLGSGDLTITSAAPFISFVDTDHNSDFNIQCNSGTFAINDTTNSATRLAINSSGTTSILNSSGNTILELKRTDTNTVGAHGTISFTASDGHSVASIGTLGDGDNEGAKLVFRTTSAAASSDPFNAATPVKMTINSTGRVEITSSEPLVQLLLSSNSNGSYIQHATGANGATIAYTGHSPHLCTSPTVGNYAIRFEGDALEFSKSNSIQARITSHGGIAFGSDTAAVNTLNHYEEGYWDPAIYTGMDNGSGGAPTYSVQHGRYTKIGNQVTVNYYIQFNVAFSTGGHIVLSGLPFNITTPAENSSGFGLTTYQQIVSSLMMGYGLQNLDRIAFYNGANSVQSANNTDHSSMYLIGGFTYFTES